MTAILLGAGSVLHSATQFLLFPSSPFSSPPSASALLPSFVTVGLTLRTLVLITLNKLRNWATLKQPTSSSIQFHIVSLTFRDRVYFMSAVVHQMTCVKFCYICYLHCVLKGCPPSQNTHKEVKLHLIFAMREFLWKDSESSWQMKLNQIPPWNWIYKGWKRWTEGQLAGERGYMEDSGWLMHVTHRCFHSHSGETCWKIWDPGSRNEEISSFGERQQHLNSPNSQKTCASLVF